MVLEAHNYFGNGTYHVLEKELFIYKHTQGRFINKTVDLNKLYGILVMETNAMGMMKKGEIAPRVVGFKHKILSILGLKYSNNFTIMM